MRDKVPFLKSGHIYIYNHHDNNILPECSELCLDNRDSSNLVVEACDDRNGCNLEENV